MNILSEFCLFVLSPLWKFIIFLNPLRNTCSLGFVVSNPFGIFMRFSYQPPGNLLPKFFPLQKLTKINKNIVYHLQNFLKILNPFINFPVYYMLRNFEVVPLRKFTVVSPLRKTSSTGGCVN